MPTPPTADARFEREALIHLPEVARFALSLTRDQHEADDLVQDAFLNAYRSWHQYQAGSECRAWLFTICRHQFFRSRKRAERVDATADPELESLAAAALHASARQAQLDTMFDRTDLGDAIRDAMAALPPAFREVALLVDVHDQSYDEASAVLGVPIGTVRSRLFRARRLLQERLIAHARDAGFASARSRETDRDSGNTGSVTP